MAKSSDPPPDWESRKIGEIAVLRQGSVLRLLDMDGGSVPVFGANGIIGWHSVATHDEPQVVIGCRGSCGVVRLTPARAFITNNAMIVSPASESVDRDFLSFALRVADLTSAVTGSSQPQITGGRLASVEVVIPPLPEQHGIAHVLRIVDRAREQTEQVLAAARELKRSLMQYLFTYGSVTVDRAQDVALQERKEIGVCPDDWDAVTVADLGEVVTGTTPSTAAAENFGGPYPFFTPGDLGERMYLRGSARTLSDGGLSRARPLPRGTTLVVCIGASIGKVGITDVPLSATNQQINALVPDAKHWPEFIYYLMSHNSRRIVRAARRTTMPILAKGAFKDLAFALPRKPEQQLIAEALMAADRKIDAETQRQEALTALFGSLLHDLMTARVRLDGLAAEFAR
jgi:type I restriction enzyme, S subunit